MAAAVSFVSRVHAQAVAPTRLRLKLDDEATVRFIFSGEWERVAGIKSNHEAQVAALLDTPRRGARNVAANAVLEDQPRLALDVRNFRAPKLPLALRGWSTCTARGRRSNSGGYPMQMMVIEGVRCPTGPQERWALGSRFRSPAGTMVDKERINQIYRALVRMGATVAGPRLVVALNLMYGQRDPHADYALFGELAPLAHLTPTALDLADRATRALRRHTAEAAAEAAVTRTAGAQAERVAILDRIAGPGCRERRRGFSASGGHERLEDLARAEAATHDLAAWTSARADADRAIVETRPALSAAISQRKGAELTDLVNDVRRGAEQLLVRATNALLVALRGES